VVDLLLAVPHVLPGPFVAHANHLVKDGLGQVSGQISFHGLHFLECAHSGQSLVVPTGPVGLLSQG
jgi:hypothetical protein